MKSSDKKPLIKRTNEDSGDNVALDEIASRLAMSYPGLNLAPRVSEQPVVELTYWQDFACRLWISDNSITPHLVGLSTLDDRWRITSEVMGFDRVARCATTRSGRVYTLQGAGWS